MIYCIRNYEKDAYTRGVINSDEPRGYSNIISWPIWNNSLSPDFTLFMPVQRRATTVYGANVEPLPGGAAAGGGEGEVNSSANPLHTSSTEMTGNGSELELMSTAYTVSAGAGGEVSGNPTYAPLNDTSEHT